MNALPMSDIVLIPLAPLGTLKLPREVFEQYMERPAAATSLQPLAESAQLIDWPLLEQAVEQKIEEQIEFVQWWRDHVGVRHAAGSKKNADLRSSFSTDQAEELTGITQQQVSKWRKRLADRAKYAAALFGVPTQPPLHAICTESRATVRNVLGFTLNRRTCKQMVSFSAPELCCRCCRG